MVDPLDTGAKAKPTKAAKAEEPRIEPGRDIVESPHEIEELRAFLARYRSDTFLHVQGKKKDRHYMWVNVREPIVRRFKSMGFRVCTDPDIVVWEEGGLDAVKPDGSKVIGDLILMEMPIERWKMFERLRLERQKDASTIASRIAEEFHEEGRRAGVETFEDRRSEREFKR